MCMVLYKSSFCNANSKYIIILKAVYILHKDCVPNYYGNKQKEKKSIIKKNYRSLHEEIIF